MQIRSQGQRRYFLLDWLILISGDIVTPLPGTVIDHTITSRMTSGAEADFYLIGHKAIQVGTLLSCVYLVGIC